MAQKEPKDTVLASTLPVRATNCIHFLQNAVTFTSRNYPYSSSYLAASQQVRDKPDEESLFHDIGVSRLHTDLFITAERHLISNTSQFSENLHAKRGQISINYGHILRY
jgi:hypothetical protein